MTIAHQNGFDTLNLLVDKFITSHLNISPEALLFIDKCGLNLKDIENLISKISFSPTFHGVVTLELLIIEFGINLSGLISEFGNNAVNYNQKEIISDPTDKEDEFIEEIFDNNLNSLDFPPINEIIKNSKSQSKLEKDNDKSKNHKIDKLNDGNKTYLSVNEKPTIDYVPKIQQVLSPVRSLDLEDEIVIINSDSDSETGDESKSEIGDESESETGDESSKENDKLTPRLDDTELAKIREEKRKTWEKLQIRNSTSIFRAIASEYDSQIEIIQDPTGKLFTEGKIEEFIDVQRDKFEKLKSILKRRPEGTGLLDINMIARLESSVEVKFIGMVVEKRQTSKRNYLIEFEDPTGTCTTLVRQEPKELYDLISHLLPDHVVIVEGYLSITQKTNSRIIMVNNIHFPDSPNTHLIQCPSEDLSICFISDIHFGSKDWRGKEWNRFVNYLNCNLGDDKQVQEAGKIKYLCIAGDIVDGIGIYPNQDKHLDIKDIYKQYEVTAEYLAEIPEYIQIIASPGDHDAVRKAIPNPAIPKDMAPKMYDNGIKMVGCPTLVSLHGIKVQMFHGTSLIDMNMSIPGMSHEDPVKTMKEFIRARDLAPTYGKKTEMAPVSQNWMIMETLPDILHTGHLHTNGAGYYHGILAINSGCFQDQTDFQKSLGIVPDYGKPTIVNIKEKLNPRVIDLAGEF